jgi:hypothetical protein
VTNSAAEHPHPAAGRLEQAEGQFDEGALAGPVGTDEADDAGLDGHGEIGESVDVVPVALLKLLGLDEDHGR